MPFDKTGRIVPAKQRPPKVVSVQRKRLTHKPSIPPTSTLPTVIGINRMEVEGTRRNITVVLFTRLLSDAEKTKIEELMVNHDCYDMITGRVWRKSDILRISIKIEFVCECGCRDIRQMMREIVQSL